MPGRYRKNPVVIEAMQFTGTNQPSIFSSTYEAVE